MLSEAKHLCPSGETLRFAQGDNILPILLVKNHHRAGVGEGIPGEAASPPQRHKCRGYAP